MATKPANINDFANALNAQQLKCRTYGHGFENFTASRVRVEGNSDIYYEQTLKCKCKVMRRVLMSRTGAVLRSSYDYSAVPGYLSHGLGRITGTNRDVLRLEGLVRHLPIIQTVKKV